MHRLYSWLILLHLLACEARLHVHDSSFTPHAVLHITYEVASVACRSKSLVLVNGTSPGPPIHLTENVTSWVRVYNDMDGQNLTMHWHGLSQSTAPFSDGTPQASQWPIPPHHYFDYEIHPAVNDAGTYFYHSHVGFQAVSAAGPLIVEESSGKPPYEYDDERMLLLSELYNQTNDVIEEGLTAAPFRFSGETEAILVNGKSYPALNAEQVNTLPPYSTSPLDASLTCAPEVVEVEPGCTYRVRTLGGMALGLVTYQFQQHDTLTVIAADGQYTLPVDTDHINIAPGQRFDYLLHTKTMEELNALNKTMFWIQLELRYRTANVTSYAILKYNVKGMVDEDVPPLPPARRPLKLSNNPQSWLEYELSPLRDNKFPSSSEVTRTVYLSSDQLNPFNRNPPTSLTSNYSFWTVNNRTW